MAGENTDAAKKTVTLGDFELKRQLGKGGMGVVYLAHQISLDRDCAVKVMAREIAAKPGFVDRFIREARSMAKIAHPNVVSCYAVSEHKGNHYVAMELIDGKSMQDWLNQLGKIPLPDALLVTIICGEALHYAHELNMVHRDIKPDNILVTRKGVVKVADLGLAKAVDDEDMSLTQSGTGLGTPHYMAPEQARNAKRVDRRCDVYALGCTLYHFVTGKTPFAGGSILELITNKEKGTFTPARRLNNEVPDRLNLMIDKAMAADPQHRYQSCADFIKDLESLGLESEALTFISDDQRVVVRRKAASTIIGGQTRPGLAPQKKSGTTPAGAKSAPTSKFETSWFVQVPDAKGKPSIMKMTAVQVMTAMKNDKFDEKTRASVNAKGPFLPLAQIPAFDEEARKMLTRLHAHVQEKSLKTEYNKLAKQYERRKIWRALHNMLNNTLGMMSLVVYLAALAAVGVGLYYLIPWVYSLVATNLGAK
ncbi:serine/threonine protein kinase [Planctomicrobium sp. SH664]|uniref:serine/threonine protein kinase n=1 Tax=Planctomicrobium sp. SH664 TaxID=3448125 RepID=UPI003F5B1C6B